VVAQAAAGVVELEPAEEDSNKNFCITTTIIFINKENILYFKKVKKISVQKIDEG